MLPTISLKNLFHFNIVTILNAAIIHSLKSIAPFFEKSSENGEKFFISIFINLKNSKKKAFC
jgi:hypothetical protein